MSYYNLLLLVTLFIITMLAFQPSNGAPSPAEKYWKNKVGDIPMPKPLMESLLGENERLEKFDSNYHRDFGTHEHIFYVWGGGKPEKAEIPQDGRVIYFKEDEVLSGSGGVRSMKLYFKKPNNEAKFLPLNQAKSVAVAPNSTSDDILNILSVVPNSTSAQDIELMVEKCHEKAVKGEVRSCVNSVEGMVDYAFSLLVNNSGKKKSSLVVASTTEEYGMVSEYDIGRVERVGSHSVVCHKIRNPYAVFLCHSIQKTQLYNVSLVRAHDGKQTSAFAICHHDTSSWNPAHYAFQLLNTHPGGAPICHFVCAEAVVWYALV